MSSATFERLTDLLLETGRFRTLCQDFHDGPISLWGFSGSGQWLTLAAMIRSSTAPVMVLVNDDDEARAAVADIASFAGTGVRVAAFPSHGLTPYESISPHRETLARRIEILHELIKGDIKVLVTPVEAAAQRLIPLEALLERVVQITKGQTIDPMDLAKSLTDLGYERVDAVEDWDQFAHRGGIVDIYVSTMENPVRIEFFGDEIESIRTFDTLTQKSISEISGVEVLPCREILLTRDFSRLARARITETAKSRKLFASVDKLNLVLEKLEERIHFQGIEGYMPYFYDDFDTLFDYMGKGFRVVVWEPAKSLDKFLKYFKQLQRLYTGDVFDNNILPGPDSYYLDPAELKKRIEKSRPAAFFTLRPEAPVFGPTDLTEVPFRSLVNPGERFDLFADEVRRMVEADMICLLCVSSHGRAQRLAEMLQGRSVTGHISTNFSPGQGGAYIFEGDVCAGFELPVCNIALITEKEIFRAPGKKRSSTKKAAFLTTFAEISLGDFVVHVDHGIGVYDGITLREVDGEEKDFIAIRYSGNDRLFVPLEQAIKVQKYVGDEGYSPHVDKLNSTRWEKTKKSVRKQLQEMARELIELYASRMTKSGHRFAADTLWQDELEASFPFEETDDQLRAIEDVKSDMESPKPMDRLICGDVGYGKTEVAVRAAFKAVQDGKQVAILVPTTVLAQQHFSTFRKRFGKFPVKVEMLSRLRTAEESRKITTAMAHGELDVVVGTHKMLAQSIEFQDLGLLIVDEEQRFGVKHKERIKELRHEVDCLTLTATPIPRTLQFSLSGVRDMSIINTPPVDRLAIKTFVMPYEEHTVKMAIQRELDREGQIYFVYNKVENIDNFATYVRSMIPGLRVAVGHGQMDRKHLEKVMLDFMSCNYDVLICSTIIESGLDIPNANTIFVYDAHNFGLTQLYQLRGRVGREREQAYAYFFYRRDQVLTELAEKRLRTIEEFTELGSGFKIALKDLEMRGAGSLLGTAQSGFMKTIGFELYCQLMERAIKELKGEIPADAVETDVSMNLGLDAYLPGDYIADLREKMTLYKRLSSTVTSEEVIDLRDEVIDRFGPLSKEGVILFASRDAMLLMGRVGAVAARRIRVLKGNDKVRLMFSREKRMDPMKVMDIAEKWGSRIRFSTDIQPGVTIELNGEEGLDLIALMESLLSQFK